MPDATSTAERGIPTGEQHRIRAGDQEAVVVEVGGAVRSYDVGGVAVLDGFGVDEIPEGARGAPLVPWPNRVKDGRWTWEGQNLQLDLTEPGQHNAIHGFGLWQSWVPRERSEERVVLGTVMQPRPGYPWRLDVTVAYALGDDGLAVETRARNLSTTPAPYAAGAHPYLHPGADSIDAARLVLRAGTRVDTGEQQIPTQPVPVEDTPYDFRSGASLAGLEVDHAFGDLERDADALAWLELDRADGRVARVWMDAAYRWFEVFTGDALSVRPRGGLGVEPMTAPPDAFNSGTDLVVLDPGADHVGRWGIRLT
ncbi:MAG TPA: aldose 1-epimerase family protein [Jiangellales bacterium]|nr:aldose 1-epimerase family protein [Jiangellales bacterium]